MPRTSAGRSLSPVRCASLLAAALLLAVGLPVAGFAQDNAPSAATGEPGTSPEPTARQAAPSPAAPDAGAPATGAPDGARVGGEGMEPAAPALDAPPAPGDALGERFEAPPPGVEGDAGPGALPHDLSPLGMYRQADVVVKAVLIGLGIASIVNLAILIGKSFEISVAKRRARRAISAIVEANGLSELLDTVGRRRGPGAEMVRAAADEVLKSGRGEATLRDGGLKERVSSRLGRIESGGGRRLSAGTGVLATIGSTAPFIGLFGTVWGIMNAFIGIAQAQTTNLAIVAPGIAEALFATAVGLVAAIPAVVIYNVFARQIAGYRALLADASAGIERLVSRDLDRGTVVSGNLRLVAERA